ncbi:MAG: amidohydrolase family protein [Candidatus Izemoplasmatales bacterium]|nr:amidohydrolase family protein [Candidatus Izemoplasmatales bacterium]
MYDKRIINGKVYIDGTFKKTNLYINKELIIKIDDSLFDAKETIDVNQGLVIPGLIDPHVHFDLDLGKIKSRDNFYYGTLQAAYGGITTVIDFLDPVDNPDDLEKAYNKRLSEAETSVVDYFFHATIKNPKCNLEEFVLKMKSLGISSLKLFTTYSDSDRRTADKDIIELLKLSEKYGFLILAHIENDDLINLNPNFKYNALLKSRPTLAETKEALKLAGYVERYGGFLYMVHLSSGETLEKLKCHYSNILNKRFFIESCPHYFLFTNDFLEKCDGFLYTLAPPLRKRKERTLLKDSFLDIFTIGTDHCAFNIADKDKNFLIDIPLGIGGIEFAFDIMYELFKEKTIDKMSCNIASLYPELSLRGSLKEGNYASLFVYDLYDNFIDNFHGNTNYNLYENFKRSGMVLHTMNRGEFVVKNGEFVKSVSKKI